MEGPVTIIVLVAALAHTLPTVAKIRRRSLVVVLGTISLLTSKGWSTVTTSPWRSPIVTPSCPVFEALLLSELGLYIMLELGVEPFAHLLETRQRQIELPHHPLVVLSHLLKLHEDGPHVKLFLDDVTSYDKFLAHRLEAPTALLLQTEAEAETHFGHEVILHQVHLQPLEASPCGRLIHIHVGVIVLQKYIVCSETLVLGDEESNHIEDQRYKPSHF